MYVVLVPFSTLAGDVGYASYQSGDKLVLIEPTDDAPFKFQSRISNWLVKCKNFEPPAPEAVWSGVWRMIEKGTIKWEHEGELAVGVTLPRSEVVGTVGGSDD